MGPFHECRVGYMMNRVKIPEPDGLIDSCWYMLYALCPCFGRVRCAALRLFLIFTLDLVKLRWYDLLFFIYVVLLFLSV
jgi:hypothetical protein